ncbi:MAG: M15 family metallopeptidase [Clostridia bacterium]|nr:M15 family metallopeptidase [Clostridia bacterium]
MKKVLALMMALLCLSGMAAAEEWNPDEDYSFEDVSGISWETITYENVPWNFPIDIMELDPELIQLANKHMFLSKNYVPDDLVTMKKLKLDDEGNNTSGGVRLVNSDMQLQRECAEALVALCDAARAEGHELYLKSAYRSYKTQDYMYYNRLEANDGYDDGWVTKPGASDHQTGLGCDVVPGNWTDRGMNEDMAEEEECQWMAEHCAEFGFVIRYPADKEEITEINYEPWHLRYVGVDAATYIMENGLCLEEFHEMLNQAIDEFVAAGGPEFLVEDFRQVSAEDKYD